MDARIVSRSSQSKTKVHSLLISLIRFERILLRLFRIVELILNDQINFPFELRICSEQSRIEEFPHTPNRHYHLEEILPDDSEQNKDSVFIPVAHYIKVISKEKK